MPDIENVKLNLIQEIIHSQDSEWLENIYDSFRNTKNIKHRLRKDSFSDFLNIFSQSEAEDMKKVIKQACEKIHPDDWEKDSA